MRALPASTSRAFLVVAVLAMYALPAAAESTSDIPSYYEQLNFSLTGPSAWTAAVGGYANPGVYAAMPGGELEWYGSFLEDDGQTGLDRWGLFWSLRHLGIGAVHRRYPTPDGTWSVTDYRLALSMGDQASSLGVSLGWSRGDTDQMGRTTVMQIGAVQRFGPWVSAGLAGTFSTETSDQSGLFDLAVRPLGTDRVALFGDIELPRGVALEDAPWSAGATVQVVPGIHLTGRYFEDESFAVAFAYTFGGDVSNGYMRSSVRASYDKDSELRGTDYGIRLGFKERNGLGDLLFRNRYYGELNLKGSLVHTRYRYFDPNHSLYETLSNLESIRTDARVAGVAVNLSGARMSRGNAWELRQKLIELQAAGKHVVVFIDEAGMTQYHVASVADRVVMDPEGMMLLPGYVLGRTYIRSMLDKMGLGIEEWRLFTHKSAMESLVRHEMSDADREQRQALVDQYYRTMTDDVAASREVSNETIDRWIDDVTVVLPRQALDAGMVDVLGRWEDVKDVIKEIEGGRKPLVAAQHFDRSKYPSRRWGRRPEVAVVYALGMCAMDEGIKARRLEKVFHSLRDRDDVKAVVFRVNSPGGSAMASDVVAEALRECAKKKPVIVSQGDVAASGGYWVSMYGDEILVQPTTVTGSIGVIGGWVWDDGVGEKLGMEGDFVEAGEHADLMFNIALPFIGVGLPHRPLEPEEHETVFESIRTLYGEFKSKVAEGRGMSTDEVEIVAQGRVWTGVQGVDNGLADRVGGLQDAIDIAREKAGYDRDDDIAVVEYYDRGLFNLGRYTPSLLAGLARAATRERDSSGAFLNRYDIMYLREIANRNGRPLCLTPPEFVPAEETSR
jgi:protease-4